VSLDFLEILGRRKKNKISQGGVWADLTPPFVTNGNELTLVLPRFLSCCISVGLQCSGSYPVIIHERWGVSSACGTGPVSLCCDDTGSTIHSHTERWLGWQQRTLRSASVMHHPVLDPKSKNTDGWKKIQLIFRLAELSRKLKIRLRFGWLQTLCG